MRRSITGPQSRSAEVIDQNVYELPCLIRALFFACACHFAIIPSMASDVSTNATGIRVQGPGAQPRLIFACGDQGVDKMESMFADPSVIKDLKDLHAEISLAITDFSPQRAELVRRLNTAGIPVLAWMMLPKDQGLYLNADNSQPAAAFFTTFDAWTHDQGLLWSGVGLDIEPNAAEFAALKGHWWRLGATLLRRSLDGGRVVRARQAYSALIRHIQSLGYTVQTYQLPFMPAERRAGSSLFDRLLGTVDVRGDQEVVMLYTSVARPVGAGMLWALGPDCQVIAVGSTDGDPSAGPNAAALDWNEFSRDLIVASHFSHVVGVYNLEGCMRQGFLPRLKAMNWSESVTIPAESIRKADRVRRIIRVVMWLGSHLPYIFAAGLVTLIWIVRFWRLRRKKKRFREAATAPAG